MSSVTLDPPLPFMGNWDMEAKSYLIRLRSDCATDTIDGKVEMSQGHFDTTYSPISRSESIIGKLSLVPGHFDIQSQAS